MRVAFCGAMRNPGLSVRDLETDSGKNKVGMNTGNYIIGEYGRRTIKFDDCAECGLPWHVPMSAEEFNEKYDHLVIFAANWLSHYMKSDFTESTKWLEKIKVPVTLVGLGAQYDLSGLNYKDYVKTLNSSLVKMFQVIADKNRSISVRGFVTQDLLYQLGIENVNVTGCPTWFVNAGRQKYITKKDYSSDFKIAMHADPTRRKAYSRLYRMAEEIKDKSYILQSEFDLVPLLNGNQADISALSKKYLLSEDIFKQDNWGHIFGNLTEWEQYVKTRDLVIGLRIHGTIISLKNGVPAILFYHDGRTFEFVDVLGLPKWQIDTLFDESKNLEYFYNQTDFSEMNKKYHFLLSNYKLFLQENGLSFEDGATPLKAIEVAIPYGIRSRIDVKWYEEQYPDFKEDKECEDSAMYHYMNIGWKKGYNPSPDFNGNQYLKDYPDVAKANMNPLHHYVLHGKKEGRKVNPVK